MAPNNVANFIPEIWSKNMAVISNKKGVMKQFVNRDYEGEFKKAGDTAHIRKGQRLTANTYGGTINYQALATTDDTMLIDQATEVSFKISDIEKAQSDLDLMDIESEQATIAVNLKQDTHLLSLHAYAPAANIVSSGNDGTTGYTINKDNIYKLIAEVRRRLQVSNAYDSLGGNPVMVVPPEVEEVMVSMPEFIGRSTQQGDNVIKTGTIANILGIDIVTSTNLVSVSSKYYCPVFFRQAISFAEQVAEVEKIRLIQEFGGAFRMLNVFGAKVVNSFGLGKIIFTA